MANPTIYPELQDGNVVPQLGLEVWKASNERSDRGDSYKALGGLSID
ncbi:2,5-diketo-D-gluconic acid reductase [Salmonella enterica subsp. enterica]|nr:2,5-diketo-D-gluconic acid reductase [Salmonella enterica subsp. enterica]